MLAHGRIAVCIEHGRDGFDVGIGTLGISFVLESWRAFLFPFHLITLVLFVINLFIHSPETLQWTDTVSSPFSNRPQT